MKKNALGRGLDVLLPTNENENEGGIKMLQVDRILCNPGQPRQHFDDESLASLAESIRTAGILQPLIVTEEETGYRIVAGERRYRAARMVGLDTVPCIVREMEEKEKMEAALIENLQREDLNPLDEAEAIRQLIERCGYTQEKAANRLGRSRVAVTNLLRLIRLPDYVKERILSGEITEGHARVLAGMEDEKKRGILLERTIHEQLSVRELEELARETNGTEKVTVSPTIRELAPELKDMESRFLRTTGVKTQIHGNLKKGKLVFSYTSADELEALYQLLEMSESR